LLVRDVSVMRETGCKGYRRERGLPPSNDIQEVFYRQDSWFGRSACCMLELYPGTCLELIKFTLDLCLSMSDLDPRMSCSSIFAALGRVKRYRPSDSVPPIHRLTLRFELLDILDTVGVTLAYPFDRQRSNQCSTNTTSIF